MRFTKNKEDYAAYYKSLSPRSPLLRDLTGAFFVGGGICLLGQLLIEGYTTLGADKELSATLTSVTLIALGIFLSALGVYAKLAKIAGAGTLVPITGFANSVASPDFVVLRTVVVYPWAPKILSASDKSLLRLLLPEQGFIIIKSFFFIAHLNLFPKKTLHIL